MKPSRMRVHRSPYSERSWMVALFTESGSPPVASSTGGSVSKSIGSAPISAARDGLLRSRGGLACLGRRGGLG